MAEETVTIVITRKNHAKILATLQRAHNDIQTRGSNAFAVRDVAELLVLSMSVLMGVEVRGKHPIWKSNGSTASMDTSGSNESSSNQPNQIAVPEKLKPRLGIPKNITSEQLQEILSAAGVDAEILDGPPVPTAPTQHADGGIG